MLLAALLTLIALRFVPQENMSLLEDVKAKLAEHGQEHLLQFIDQASSEQERDHFLQQLQGLDYAHLKSDFQRAMEYNTDAKLDAFMTPLPAHMVASAMAHPPSSEMQAWRAKGLQLIAAGKVAVILLAGGQGTRLGSTDPKGMYNLELASGWTLFHVQAFRILRLQQLAKELHGADAVIPWYIMTSDSTQEPTKAFFASHNFFGLRPENIIFFPQDSVPAYDLHGKLILSSPTSISSSPDGNGGLYSSLRTHGIVDDMELRGVEHVHVYCVDNILVRVADPVFVGYCADKQAPAGALVVGKSAPDEKVGVFCMVNGKFQVVEYSEISPETASRRNPDGRLTFNEGNICNHYFTRDFLRVCLSQSRNLKLHVAKKKIPTVDAQGKPVTPTQENGVKLEKFVFDVFEYAETLAVLEMPREDIFSPLKNKAGANSAATCRQDLHALHRRYLHDAGAVFEDDSGAEIKIEATNASHACEISPVVSYAGENLEAYVKAHPRLRFPIRIDHL